MNKFIYFAFLFFVFAGTLSIPAQEIQAQEIKAQEIKAQEIQGNYRLLEGKTPPKAGSLKKVKSLKYIEVFTIFPIHRMPN